MASNEKLWDLHRNGEDIGLTKVLNLKIGLYVKHGTEEGRLWILKHLEVSLRE